MSSSSAPQKSGVNGLVIRSAIVASLGGLIFGFDTAVISGAISSLEVVFNLTAYDLGFVVAIATVGTVLGAIIAGRLAEQYGRHKILFVIGVIYIAASFGTALAINLPMLDIFRFIGGVGVGMSSVVAPIYTAEISPAAFLVFFVFMVGQLFWVLRVMPETKGVPLEKMAAKLGLDKA